MIAVLIPVLDRPVRVRPLVESLRACSHVIECRPVFLCSPNDRREIREVQKHAAPVVVPFEQGRGDYAAKINYGVKHTSDPFVFLAADDLRFHPGWAERAVACWYETRACVVGTNDLGNSRVTSGRHSTHTLVHRDYAECGTADDPGVLLHPGYWHNFVDDEFVQTAISRETFAAAQDAHVEHLHPNWGKALEDHTYRLGIEHFNDDRAYFKKRSKLWT